MSLLCCVHAPLSTLRKWSTAGGLCCSRNQQEGETGSLEEISFQQFLMVMSYFRPPTLKTSEEEKEALRREKLRCKLPRCHRDNQPNSSPVSSVEEERAQSQLKRRYAPPVWASVRWFTHTELHWRTFHSFSRSVVLNWWRPNTHISLDPTIPNLWKLASVESKNMYNVFIYICLPKCLREMNSHTVTKQTQTSLTHTHTHSRGTGARKCHWESGPGAL